MKSYILIRALVKTDRPEGVTLDEHMRVLRDEVDSNLASCGQDVLMVTAGAPPRDALEKLGENRDTYTLDLADQIIDGRSLIAPTRGVLRAVGEDRDFWLRTWADARTQISAWAADDAQGYDSIIELLVDLGLTDDADRVRARRILPGEPGYFEPVNALELRQDIARWQLAGLEAATKILAAAGPVDVMRAFTRHHEALMAVLKEHKLTGEHVGDGLRVAVVHAMGRPNGTDQIA